MGKTVGFEIGDHSVKLVYFAGKELKKAVSVALPDAIYTHSQLKAAILAAKGAGAC